ncbi:hypothetical protein ACSBR1_004645 [Camellia fascicularis]
MFFYLSSFNITNKKVIVELMGAEIADQHVCISCWGTYIDESDPWNNPSWKLGDENSSMEASEAVTTYKTHEQRLVDYISFRIPEDSFSNIRNCIGIARGFMHDLSSVKKGNASLEAVLLSVPDGYHCMDLCLYKESQIVLLLNESTTSSKSSSNGCMMIVQASDLPFVSISRSTGLNRWNLHELKVKLCNKEGLKASSIALTALAEYTDNKNRHSSIQMLEISSQMVCWKDTSKSVVDIWTEIFQKRKVKRERKTASGCSSISNEFDFLHSMISNGSTIGFGFGTTLTFGQSTSTSAGSSFFGTALSSFGDQNSFLGSQSMTPTFGTTGFRQLVFCSQHERSRVAAYTATAEVDDGSSAAKLESISAMTINKDKSHEKLRWESAWKLLVLVIHLEGV